VLQGLASTESGLPIGLTLLDACGYTRPSRVGRDRRHTLESSNSGLALADAASMADLTTEILIDIRDEIRATRTDLSSRIDQTNQRLDQTNQRLDRLGRRQVDAEIRLSTEVVALTGAVKDLRDTLLEDRDLRDKVVDHEQRIRTLEASRT
jgi:hypothetical protein